ncbi:MAG TPA: cytidine deaminase [Candidatus Stackebrandtia excrementipullorum]|nr:cytidine deaminase [Candidatus Stackebrandtia excrementipullorum]
MIELDPEDDKLVTLAHAAAARIGAPKGAAVRDQDGRTYAAASVRLPHLRLSALQLAVAQAVAAGAETLEAAAVVVSHGSVSEVVDAQGLAAVRDLSDAAPVYVVTEDGVSRVAG